ncbi:MAG: 2'-5' RNA ligase family protein [Verrucomicrobiota bacterium]|jgi:2'-5' RNA ligase
MQIYEQLWADAASALALGGPQIDPHLSDRVNDRRRGVCLIFRPSPEVQARVKAFLDELAAAFPGQYFYQPEELHVTVLTLISASGHWRSEMRDVAAFRVILRDVLGRHDPMAIEFNGVTAAPNAIMVQGFPRGEALENIRNDLRQAFAQSGFANRLDRRYRSRTAHLTAMRFARADADWRRLLAVLTAHRGTAFGTDYVQNIELVWGDWYGSTDNLRVLEEFRLGGNTGRPGR